MSIISTKRIVDRMKLYDSHNSHLTNEWELSIGIYQKDKIQVKVVE
jgi:hypothetical protein